jgi:glyoxylate/hydroxypyruvate reductase A
MVNLRAIFSVGAGVDHITSDPGWPRQVPLVRMFSPGFAQRMSEYVCLAALAVLKDLPRNIAGKAAHRWDSFTPGTATGTRVGIMGLGNLGRHAAGMLVGLGFSVAGWSTSRKAIPGVESFVGPGELGAFLAATDILVCLLPDTPETKRLIDAGLLARLPRGAGVINAGRGPQVVLDDLIAALDAGHLSAAFLDVYDPSPLPSDHPIWDHPKVIMTPYNAASGDRIERVAYVAGAIAGFQDGLALPNVYSPLRGY